MLKEKKQKSIIKIGQNKDTNLDDFISLAEAARLCSYSQEYISLLARHKLIGAVKMGRNWVITRQALFDYIEKNSAGKKGNKKGRVVADGKIRLFTQNNLLTLQFSELIKYLKNYSKKQIYLLPEIRQKAVESAKKKVGFLTSKSRHIFSRQALKRFLAVLMISALGALSLYVLPAAAKYYARDLEAIGKLADATIGKSFDAAKESFKETIEIYRDAIEFAKQPKLDDVRLAGSYLGIGFKNFGSELASGYLLLAEDFSETYLSGAFSNLSRMSDGLGSLARGVLITPANVREVLDKTVSFNQDEFKNQGTFLVQIFKAAPGKIFPGFIETYEDLATRTRLLVKAKIKPALVAFNQNLSGKIDSFSHEPVVEPKVAGVTELAQADLISVGFVQQSVPERNIFNAIGESFVADLKFLARTFNKFNRSVAGLPSKIASCLKSGGEKSRLLAKAFQRAGDGLAAFTDLSFKKFFDQIAKVSSLSKLAYENIFTPRSSRLVYTHDFITLEEARELLAGASIQYVTIEDGKIVSLVGPQGPAGKTGPAGPQGATGEAGIQGPVGPSGAFGQNQVTYNYGGTTVYGGGTTVVESLSAINSLTVGAGGLGVGGNLSVVGTVELGDGKSGHVLTVNNPATFNSSLTVASGAGTTLGGALSVSGTASLAGNTSVGGTLAVVGASTFTGNVSVGGMATITAASGNITTQGNVGIGTTTPVANLAIESTQGQTQDLFRIGTSSNPILATTTDASFVRVSAGGDMTIKGRAINPTLRGTYSYGGSLRGIFVKGRYAYITSHSFGSILILDIADPDNPVYVSEIFLGLSQVQNVYVAGDFAYATSLSGDSMTIFDVSNPYSPVYASQVKKIELDSVYDVVVQGNYAYLTSFNRDSLSVIDVSNPYNPVYLAELRPGGANGNINGPLGLAIAGKYLYTANSVGNSIAVVDISDPANPAYVTEITDPGNGELAGVFKPVVYGNYLYVGAATRGSLAVLDISNPASPSFVAEERGPAPGTSLNGARALAIAGNYVYLGASNGTVAVIDISDPIDPVYIQETIIGSTSQIRGMFIAGNYLYVSNASTGAIDNYNFIVLDISGLTVSNAEIGSLKVSNLSVDSYAQFAQGVLIQDALNVGKGAMFGGPVAINVSTSTQVGVSALKVNATSSVALIDFRQYGTGDILNLYSSSTKALSVLDTGQTILSAYPQTASPALLIQPHDVTSFSQSTSTMAYINASPTFTGDLLNLAVDGIAKFRIDYQGNAVYTSSQVAAGDIYPSVDDTFNLGNALLTRRWSNAYLSDGLFVGATTTSASGKLVHLSSTTLAFYNTDLTIQSPDGSQNLLLQPAGGNVGIGTTTPYSVLGVSTVAQAAGSTKLFTVASTTGASLFQVNANGYVGIGVSNPQGVLEVAGDIISKGTTWTARTNPVDSDWRAIAYGNGRFVAVANSTGGGSQVMTSPDGINWTARSSAEDNPWAGIAYGNGLFVAVATSGTNRVMTSPDGITWTARTAAVSLSWNSVTYGNGQFVAVASSGTGNRIMTSPDGINWISRTSPADYGWRAVAYGNGVFVAVANGSGFLDHVMTSSDGISWTLRDAAADNTWFSIAYGNGLFVAMVNIGSDGNNIMTSPDGIAWTIRDSQDNNSYTGITYGNGLFVSLSSGSTGTLRTSPDGITWTTRNLPLANSWKSVVYGNGTFVAVASSGTGDRVMTSGRQEYIPFFNDNLYQGGLTVNSGTYLLSTTTQTALTVRQASSGDILNLFDGSTEVLTVLDGGNVGIGTTTPVANLAIESIQGQTQDLFRIGTSSNAILSTTTDASFVKVSAGGDMTIKGRAINPTWKGETQGLEPNVSLQAAASVSISGDYAYVASFDREALTVLNIADPANPTWISEYRDFERLGYITSVFVVGNYAYATVHVRDSLAVLDVSNPAEPIFLAEERGPVPGTSLDGARDVFVSGNYAYVAVNTRDSLAVIDISNPSDPVFITEVRNPGGDNELDGARHVFVSGKYAYVANVGRDSLAIIDISDPANPAWVAESRPNGADGLLNGARDVYVAGNYAYVANSARHSLAIINVASSTDPIYLAETQGPVPGTSLNTPVSVFVSGNYAYVANYTNSSLAIIDISDPSNPIFVAEELGPVPGTSLNGASEVFVSGNYAYVTAQAGNSFAVIDVSGLTVSNAEIGTLKVSNLSVESFARFDQGALIQGGLNVGAGAMFNGPLAINVSTSTSVGYTSFSVTATSSPTATTTGALVRFIQNGTGDILNLFDGSTEVLTVLDGGNVGIGTTTPYSILSVSTAAQAASTTKLFTVASTTGATLFQVLADGRVKTEAGGALNNMYIGNLSGDSNTTGEKNTGVGIGTLHSNTTGINNVAFGYVALYSNVSGDYNTAIGYSTLNKNTGSNNTALGYKPLNQNTSGGNNTAIGYTAMRYNETGSGNTAVGVNAGLGVTGNSFSNNSLFGFGSGKVLETGSNNILLGYNAGNNLTTGSNNIVIGYDIDAPSATSANTLNIGNLIFGTGIDGTGTTISSGNIGIGTTTPVANLTVAGSVSARSFNGNTAASWGGPWFSTGTKDLLAWYPLAKRDSQNGQMSDISGNEHHGTITAGASAGFMADYSGRVEAAYDFDGANTKIDTGSDWIGTQAVSISAWINAETLGEGLEGRLIDNNKFIVRILNSGTGAIRITNNASNVVDTPASSITLGRWYHVVATRDLTGSDSRVYINGALSNSGNAGIPEAGTSNIIIGNSSLSNKTFDGSISDVKIFNRVLSAGEVAGLYNNSNSAHSTRLGIGTTTPSSVLSVTTALQQAATTKLFTVASTTGSTLLTVLGSGKIGVGTTSPSSVLSVTTALQQASSTKLLTVASTTGQALLQVLADGQVKMPASGLCVDDDGSCTATLGQINAVTFAVAGHSDVAEKYPSVEKLEPGDLVMADPNNPGFVIKTTGEYNNNVIGVVSEAPGFILASETEGYPIALVGRIPTKVTAVNGPIKPGDTLTVAPIPGYAMKLNEGNAGIIIGTALAAFNGGEGRISMFINPDYKTTFDEITFGEITDGQIATNAAISDLKLDTIRTAGKIALTALPVEIALLQGDTQTFKGNYIFGIDETTRDLVVFNSKIGSDIKFAVDGLYNIGSEEASAANVYTRNLKASKLIVAANTDWQNINADDYGLYLSASSGLAYFGSSAVIGNASGQISVALPAYPDFLVDGSDLLVVDDLGVGGDLYVQGSVKIAGALEFAGEGTAQLMSFEGLASSGDVAVVNAEGAQAKISDSANATGILGVVATASAEIFGNGQTGSTGLPVVVSGAARVKVTAANGPIRRGDRLTTAETEGYAMLATRPGAGVLGMALEDFAEGEGTIRVLVDLGAYYQPMAKVITVGESGSDFKSLNRALASIEDNSAANLYIIKVGPGIYEESIVLKDFVDIVGDGAGLVTIASDQSPVVTGASQARLEGVSLRTTSPSDEPVIINLTGEGSGSGTLITNVKLEADSLNPAVGVSIAGQAGQIRLSNLDFGSNFRQGIVNLASTTVSVMHSDLSEINGTALIAQNGAIKSYYNDFDGVLGDIYVSELARVESKSDLYRQVTNLGVFLDKTNQGRIDHQYIDWGWLVSESAEDSFNFNISAGEGYIGGVVVNTAGIDNLEVSASSTAYVFMTDQGKVQLSPEPALGTSTPAILIAKITSAEAGIASVVNERSNEIVVAKEDGQYRTIADAFDSISTNSEQNRWTITVKPGIYNESVDLKPYVDLVGSGDNTVIMSINRPVITADLGTMTATAAASILNEARVKNLKLSLSGDIIGQPMVLASSSKLVLEDVVLEWSGEGEGTGIAVTGSSDVEISRLKASGLAYGVTSEYRSDNSSTSTVKIAYSSLASKAADIATVCIDALTGQACTEATEVSQSAVVNIVSSYNTLTGSGANFLIAKGTVISSAHDSYLRYSGEGSFRQNDYFRNMTDGKSPLFNIQNAGLSLFSVNASGTIAINPQNTMGDSVVINSATASSTLTVINSGGGTALRVVGDMVLASATSSLPVSLTAEGGEINFGKAGDTINLNVEGVTYNFKENVRRNTLSAYLPAPTSGDKVWGNGSESWSPPENISILGIKAQYACSEGGSLQLALKDKNGNTIVSLPGLACNGYTKLEEELEHYLTTDDGMYLDVETATEGITNVTVTVEFVYDNR